jgi:hypothetical protein
MKKNITDKLKTSLDSERVKNKSINNIDERFAKADNLFNKNIKPLNEKINVVRDTFTLPEKDYELIELCVKLSY